jgi:hypothetical protein
LTLEHEAWLLNEPLHEIIQQHLSLDHEEAWIRQMAAQALDRGSVICEARMQGCSQSQPRGMQGLFARTAVGYHQLRSLRRSRCADVRNEVTQGVVDLVPDCADNGDGDLRQTTDYALVVECHQVIPGAPAPTNNQDVETWVTLDAVKCRKDTLGSSLALYQGGAQHDPDTAPSVRNTANIMKGRALGTSHYTDHTRFHR